MSLFRISRFKEPSRLNFRPPLNWKELPQRWFEKTHFKNMTLDMKRFYGDRFGLKCQEMSHEELDDIFLQEDLDDPSLEKDEDMPLPMVPGIKWYGRRGKPYLELIIDERYKPDVNGDRVPYCGRPEDGSAYRPWLPREPCPHGKLAAPADEYDEPEPQMMINDNIPWSAPLKAEIPLVYPPSAPESEVAGRVKDANGKWRIAYKPLPDDWLHVMLDEQEARFERLKNAFSEAQTDADKATMELTMLRKTFQEEQEQSDALIKMIFDICGPEYVNLINDRTNRGVRYGEILNKEELEEQEDREREREAEQRRLRGEDDEDEDEVGSEEEDGGDDGPQNDQDEGDDEVDEGNRLTAAEEDDGDDMNDMYGEEAVYDDVGAAAHADANVPHNTDSNSQSTSTSSGILENASAGLKKLTPRWFPYAKRSREDEGEDNDPRKRLRLDGNLASINSASDPPPLQCSVTWNYGQFPMEEFLRYQLEKEKQEGKQA